MSHINLTRIMERIPQIFNKIGVQILYFLLVPSFFVSFVLIYRPFDIDEYLDLGRGLFAFNITMITCIILVTLVITRLIFYFSRLHLSEGWYLSWCFGEICIAAHFVALYVWLMSDMAYLKVVGHSCGYLASVMFYPYLIIGLSVRWVDSKNMKNDTSEVNTRIRFYDNQQNLKLIVQRNNVLYIEAEENYIHIFYIENNKLKSYQLRATMKSIEELCRLNSLIRCHRSYYINTERVKLLRKDKEGIIMAELDAPETRLVPVSKRYYDSLSQLL